MIPTGSVTSDLQAMGSRDRTYVERYELLPVGIEGVVVEFNKLLCRVGVACQPLYHHIALPSTR
jgi:hypothetical protein